MSSDDSKIEDNLFKWLQTNKLTKIQSLLNENDVTELEDLKVLDTEKDINEFIQALGLKVLLRKKFKNALTQLNNISEVNPNNQKHNRNRNNTPPPQSRRKQSISISDDDDTQDIDYIRSKWDIGSLCQIYSHSKRKWIDGKIINIYNDNDGEWLTVKYARKTKDLDRYSDDIRPMNNNNNNNNNSDYRQQNQFNNSQNNMQNNIQFEMEKMKMQMEQERMKMQFEMQKQRIQLEAEQKKQQLEYEKHQDKLKYESQMKIQQEESNNKAEQIKKEKFKLQRQMEREKQEQLKREREIKNKMIREAHAIEEKANMKLQNMQSEAELIKQEKIKLQQMFEEKAKTFEEMQQEKEDLLNAAGISVIWEKEINNGKPEPLSEHLSNIIEKLKINQTYNTMNPELDSDDEKSDYLANINKKVGVIYFQKGFYDNKQMQNINNIFGMNMDKAPKILFGDDYNDKFRGKHIKRQRFGGQSKVMGHWDRKYGFGIPTSFDNSKSLGFIYNNHNFTILMKKLFKELKIYLLNGCDIIIPYPSKKDLNQRRNKYYKTGGLGFSMFSGQVIYHNLGTGISSLSFDHLKCIQENIDELKTIASNNVIVDQKLYKQNRSLSSLNHNGQMSIKDETSYNRMQMRYANVNVNNNQFSNENDEHFIITKHSKDTAVMKDMANKYYNIVRKIITGVPIWQWKENDGTWKNYSEKINDKVEKLTTNQSYVYTFNGNNKKYKVTRVSKNTAFQYNLQSNYRREVRRIVDENASKNSIKYPQHWDMSKIVDYYNPVLTKTPKNEWTRVENKFLSTAKTQYPNCKVIKIETLQNQMLYDKHWNEQKSLLKLKKGDENKLNTKELFHGTKGQAVMDIVQKEGFRKEFNTAAAYGKGTYFARDARYSIGYSHKDSQNVYRMFLCSVLAGEWIKGTSQFELKSWPKKPSDGLLYDSLVDNVNNPSIYVIHDDVRALPKFVIHFVLQ